MLLGGILGATVVAVCIVLFLRRNAVPELSATAFAAAEQRWQSNAPQSYTVETQVKGLQPAIYRVNVRDGQVVSATRDGNPLRDRRTLGTWSVPGMYGTMERDLQTNASAALGQSPLQLRAEFDADLGYPIRYVRLAWGTNTTTSWHAHLLNDENSALDPSQP
jgi:hypothetical protein